MGRVINLLCSTKVLKQRHFFQLHVSGGITHDQTCRHIILDSYNIGGFILNRQSAKLNSLPNFPAIW